METEQEFVGVIQEQMNIERIRNLRDIYDEKLKEAYPLIKYVNSAEGLPSCFPNISCPIDEDGLSKGIVALELQIREDKERRRLLNY